MGNKIRGSKARLHRQFTVKESMESKYPFCKESNLTGDMPEDLNKKQKRVLRDYRNLCAKLEGKYKPDHRGHSP